MEIKARGQKDIHAIFFHFFSHGSRKLLYKRGIPSGCHYGSYRESGAIIGFAVTFSGRVYAESGRAVRKYCPRNSQTWNRTGCSGSTWHCGFVKCRHRAGRNTSPARSDQKRGFFLKCHSLEYFVNVVFVQLWLCCHRNGTQSSTYNRSYFVHIIKFVVRATLVILERFLILP